MSALYVGTALQSSKVSFALYGNFLSPTTKHILLTHPNRFSIAELHDKNVKVIKDVPTFSLITGAVKVKLHLNDERESVAFLTSKRQLIFYSFDKAGEAVIMATGNMASGVGVESISGALLESLNSCTLLVHTNACSIEAVSWTPTDDKEKFKFTTKQYRRHNFVKDMVSFGHAENAFALVEKEGCSFVCNFVKEQHGVEQLTSLPNRSFVDLGIDFNLLIPCPKLGGVFSVSASNIIFISPTVERCFPISENVRNFVCFSSQKDDLRWILIDESSDIYLMGAEIRDGIPVDIGLDRIGKAVYANCITHLSDDLFFISGSLSDHVVIDIGTNAGGDALYKLTVTQRLTNLGPMLDLISIEKRNDRKLVTSSGAYEHGSLRIIKNCISVNLLTKLPFAFVPDVYSFNFLSSPNSLFAIRTNSTHEFLEVQKDALVARRYQSDYPEHFPKCNLSEETLFAGVIEPEFYIHVDRSVGTIYSLSDDSVVTFPSGCSVDATRYGHIVVSTGNTVTWLFFNAASKSLSVISQQQFHSPIWKVKFADPDDPKCPFCFVVPLSTKRFYIVRLPEQVGPVANIVKVPINSGKKIVSIILISFPDWRSYIFCGMDDGSVDYYQFCPTSMNVGRCETLHVGLLLPMFCKIYIQRHLHLLICSDQTTVVRCDKHSLGFCNVDVKEVGTIMPLFNCDDFESVNSLLYYADGNICLGQIMDRQKVTIQRIDIGETIDKVIHDPELNLLAIATQRPNVIERKRDGRELIHQPKTAITSTVRCRVEKWSLHDDFLPPYPPPMGNESVVYQEEQCCLAVLRADRFTVLDAVDLSRFEEIKCMAITKIGNESYLMVGTGSYMNQMVAEAPESGRLIIYRLDCHNRSDPGGVLTFVTEKTFRGHVKAISVNKEMINLVTEPQAVDLIFTPSQSSLEAGPLNYVGHYVCCSAVAFDEKGESLLVSDSLQSISLVRLTDKKDSCRLYGTERTNHNHTCVNFLNEHYMLAASADYEVFVYTDLAKSANPASVQPVGMKALHSVGSYYSGSIMNAMQQGAPFLPIYRDPKKISNCLKYYATACGAIGIMAGLDETLFGFLKDAENILETHMDLKVTHSTYRSSQSMDYHMAPFIDGDFMRFLLMEDDPDIVLGNLQVPPSIAENFPNLTPGYIAYYYLRQLWSLH